MKIAILCGGDTHHHFLINSLIQHGVDVGVVGIEHDKILPPFEVKHPFESVRLESEAQIFGALGKDIYRSNCPVIDFDNVNDHNTLKRFQEYSFPITFVIGTRRLLPETIESFIGHLLNFHGGDPSYYRGLDSHLWTIYHRDFSRLATTLHRVSNQLDTGDIIYKRPLEIHRGMGLHELRAVNIRLCVDMALDVIRSVEQGNGIEFHPQEQIGRYYSFMPAVLKEIVCENFRKYAVSI
jgi:methionyl-tRNA formyltransferase